MFERTLFGLKRRGILNKWRDEHGTKLVRIWSGEWRLYWRPNGAGYTPDSGEAGVYTLADAIQRTRHCGPEKHIVYRFIEKEPNHDNQ